MARPREFDEQQALDRAMLVFWQRGFAATSIADLVEATGLGRQSLYNTFGDKQELFGRTLERYTQKFAELSSPLRSSSAGLDELRSTILQGVRHQQDLQCGTCMVVKTAFDHQVQDPAILHAVKRASEAMRRLVAQVLRQAQARGEVDPSRDPNKMADFVYSLNNGLSTLAQTGASREQVEETLDFGLDSLRART